MGDFTHYQVFWPILENMKSRYNNLSGRGRHQTIRLQLFPLFCIPDVHGNLREHLFWWVEASPNSRCHYFLILHENYQKQQEEFYATYQLSDSFLTNNRTTASNSAVILAKPQKNPPSPRHPLPPLISLPAFQFDLTLLINSQLILGSGERRQTFRKQRFGLISSESVGSWGWGLSLVFFRLQMVRLGWQTIIGLEYITMSEKRAWTEEEDLLLKLVFETSQLTKWSHIARRLQEQHGVRGRNGKQCKERYITHIDTSHPKEQWSYSDEQRMFDLHNELGNKWAIIGSKLDGRSDNCVKNHFYSKLRKALRKINRVVQTNYKKELKEFKPNILYRIVEVSEENFKSAPSYEKNFTIFSHQLKNELFQFSYDDEVAPGSNDTQFENINIEQANELIDKLNEFGLNYKKKAKKQRRCSDSGQDLLAPRRYLKPRCNSENEESDPSSNVPSDAHLEDISDELINQAKPIKRSRKSSEECSAVLLDRMRTRAFSQGSQNLSTESNNSGEVREDREADRVKRESADLEGALDGLHILEEEEPPHPLMMKKETSKYSDAMEREDFHFFEDSQIEMRILPEMDLGFHRDSQFDDNIFIM